MEKSALVEMWLNTCCSSERSVHTYRREVGKFFDMLGKSPEEMNAQWKQVKYDLKLRDEFIEEMNETIESFSYADKDLTPNTIAVKVCALSSFFHSLKIPVEPRKQKRIFVRYHNRDIRREEIRRIVEAGSVRERAFFLFMCEGGMRPDTLVRLKYRNIKEDYEAGRIPMKVELDAEIMKCRVEGHFSFIGEDAVNALKSYLGKRQMNDDDYIFVHRRSGSNNLERVSPSSFSQTFSAIAKRLGIIDKNDKAKMKKVRLYGLRKYFNNNAKADRAYIEFWMGHIDAVKGAYISRDVEEHRKRYAEGYENLRVFSPDKTLTDLSSKLAEKDLQIKALTRQVERLEPLMKLSDLLGDEETLRRFVEEVSKAKSGRVFLATSEEQ